MGDLSLKQFSIVVMVSAALMNGLAHLLGIFNLFFDAELLSYYVSVVIRFGELGLIMGCVLIYLVIKNNRHVKAFAILFSMIGISRFFLIEFSMIRVLDVYATVLLMIQLSLLCFLFKSMSQMRIPILIIKSRVSTLLIAIFGLSSIILTILPKSSNERSILMISAVSSMVYIVYQIGVYIYFKEWYKEAYTYGNAHLIDI